MGNGTTPKLILLPNSIEDIFRAAGMIAFNMHACLQKILSVS